MPSRDDIVAEARKWVGTPFRIYGRALGKGCDCLGLVVGVAHGLGISDADFLAYGPDPAGIPDIETMLGAHLDRIEENEAGAGDVLFLNWNRSPRHFAILTPRNVDSRPFNMIHAYEPEDRVVEHVYDKKWNLRFVSAWRFRDAEPA